MVLRVAVMTCAPFDTVDRVWAKAAAPHANRMVEYSRYANAQRCPSASLSGGARSNAAYPIHSPAMRFDAIRFDSIDPARGYTYQREYRVSADDGLWATDEPKGSRRSAL